MVFFRKQDGLDDDLQKELIQRLGELSGKPSTSGLHIHPIANSGREHSVKDDEISVISSAQRQTLYKDRNYRKQTARREWHSDITFEPIPSDYTLLRLTELPKTGGGKSPLIALPDKPHERLIPIQTHCGLPAMRFTIVSPSHTRSSSRV